MYIKFDLAKNGHDDRILQSRFIERVKKQEKSLWVSFGVRANFSLLTILFEYINKPGHKTGFITLKA